VVVVEEHVALQRDRVALIGQDQPQRQVTAATWDRTGLPEPGGRRRTGRGVAAQASDSHGLDY
jgi:hypothetical protein